jgi:protein MBA1
MQSQPRGRARKSQVLAQREQLGELQNSGRFLDYVGVIEGTFVPPHPSRLPPFFTLNPVARRDRIQLEKARFGNLIHQLRSAYMAFRYVRPRLRLQMRETPEIARQLYEDMYTALGRGVLDNMRDRLNPGCYTALQQRVAERAPGTKLLWTLHRYVSPPKRVSYVFALPDLSAPKDERTGIMQAVVRLHSVQSLVRVKTVKARDPAAPGGFSMIEVPIDRDDKVIPRQERIEAVKRQRKETVEYAVVERKMIKGKVGEWRLWGLTQETTVEALKASAQKSLDAARRKVMSKASST